MTPEERASRGRSSSEGDSGEETNPESVHESSGEDFARADPDVLLDVPKIHVDELNLGVDDLKAHVSLRTRLADLLDINVGLDVSLSAVKLETKGVEAEAQLKARLENVQAIVERTLSSVDENPELIKDLTNLSRHGESNQTHEQREQPALQRSKKEDSGPRITAAARKKAEELGVDTASLQGTGSGGRIVLGDVQRASRTSSTSKTSDDS